MRAMFGVVSLLVALAVVGILAARQLKATGVAAATPPAAATPTAAGTPGGTTVREASQQVQQRVKADVARALQEGAARREADAP